MKDIFLVDADDTILDFHGVSESALKELFAEFSILWKEEYLAEYRKINDGLWRALERKELTREKLVSDRFHVYFKHLGMTEVDASAFNERYIRILSTRPVYFKGAEEFLQNLRNMGRIYIVTNGTADVQKSRFSICKLYEKVDGVFISELVGADKPDKKYTEYVVSHIEGFGRERAIWIGDSLSADIKAANEEGIDSVWFNPKKKKRNGAAVPTYEAENYEKIVDILQKSERK